jgi:hypothetical protein
MKLHEMIVELIDDDEEHEAWNYEEHNRLLERYPTEGDPEWLGLKEIVVSTERDKQQFLQAFKYLHDNRTIDTDFLAVNTLVHIYMNPDLIKVKS